MAGKPRRYPVVRGWSVPGQFPGAKQICHNIIVLKVLSEAQILVTFRIILTESQEAWERDKNKILLFSTNIIFTENKKCTGKQI